MDDLELLNVLIATCSTESLEYLQRLSGEYPHEVNTLTRSIIVYYIHAILLKWYPRFYGLHQPTLALKVKGFVHNAPARPRL